MPWLIHTLVLAQVGGIAAFVDVWKAKKTFPVRPVGCPTESLRHWIVYISQPLKSKESKIRDNNSCLDVGHGNQACNDGIVASCSIKTCLFGTYLDSVSSESQGS